MIYRFFSIISVDFSFKRQDTVLAYLIVFINFYFIQFSLIQCIIFKFRK